MTPHKVRAASSNASDPGSAQGSLVASARRLGWAAFETPAARRSSAHSARVALVVFSLHIALFNLILTGVFPTYVGTYYYGLPVFLSGPTAVIFLPLCLLYLTLAVLVGLDVSVGRLLGYVLSVVSIVVWTLMFVGGAGIYSDAATWLLPLSIFDGLVILILLFALRDLAHAPEAAPSA